MNLQLTMRSSAVYSALILAVVTFGYIHHVPNGFERIALLRVIELPAFIFSIVISLNSSELLMQMIGLLQAFFSHILYIYI